MAVMDGHAPGDLELIERFVNTLDVERGSDELGDRARLTAWLGAAGLAPAGAAIDEPAPSRHVPNRAALGRSCAS